MAGWGFDTTGILQDILDRMEKDFNRLSLPSDIIEPLNELTREFAKDNEQYTSLPTFSVSAKAELLDDPDDWWKLPRLRRKPVSELLRKFERASPRSFEVAPDRHVSKSTRREERHRDDGTEFRKMRGFSDNRRLYRKKHFYDVEKQDSNNEKDSHSLPHISVCRHLGKRPGAGRSHSVPPQEYQTPTQLRPRSVPVDCYHYKSLFPPAPNFTEHQTPETSQKSYQFHEKNEELERPKVPDSLLPVGPEIKLLDVANGNSSVDYESTANKTNCYGDNVYRKNKQSGLTSVRDVENNRISENGATQHLQKLLSDLCSEAQRNSLPPEICRKDELEQQMNEEFRSESLPDIVKCDNRRLNGRVPRFAFRSGSDLPWEERRQRIEAALSWLRSELELLRAQDKALLSQLQHCQETIDVITKQKSVALYDSDEDEGHWEDWELAEYEKIMENTDTSDSTEDNSTGTVISVYELKPIGRPVTDIECSV